MIKKLSISLVLVVACLFAQAQLGRNDRGEYEIGSPADLQYMSAHIGSAEAPADGHYILTRDIDMSQAGDFVPIGTFTGHFNGNRRAIRNLTIRQDSKSSVGLFAVLGTPEHGAVVENLALIDIYVMGQSMVGGIAGTSYGEIRRCFVGGEVDALLHCCGGIAGRLQQPAPGRTDAPSITDCIAAASVVCLRDSDSQGGVCGRILAVGGKVANCISAGEVYGRKATGGIVGKMVAGSSVEGCVVANRWIAPDPRTWEINPVAGVAPEGARIDKIMVWDRYAPNAPQGAAVLSAIELLKAKNYAGMGWDTDRTWNWESDENAYFPSLGGFSAITYYCDFTWRDVVEVTPQVSSTLDQITIRLDCPPGNYSFAIELASRGIPRKPLWQKSSERTFTGLQPATAYEFCCRIKGQGAPSRWYRMTVNTDAPVSDDPTPRNVTAVVTTDPARSITIAWSTPDTTLKNPVVRYAPESKPQSTQEGASCVSKVSRSSDKMLYSTYYNFHNAVLTDLTPGTRYVYSVGDASGRSHSPEYSFTTAPAKSAPFTFVYMSDPQLDGPQADAALSTSFRTALDKVPSPAFVYFAGDMAERGFNCDQMDRSNACAAPLLNQVFTVNTQGNHDDDDFFYLYYPVPSAAQDLPGTYSFDYGDAHFMVLNTELGTPAQLDATAAWLEKDLRANGRKWNVVMMHKALYAGTDHVDMEDIDLLRAKLTPLFEKLSIDAVLTGHDHCFTRGFILDGQNASGKPKMQGGSAVYTKPKAPLYMVNGTAGTTKWYSKIAYDATKLHHVASDYAFADKCGSDYGKPFEEQTFSTVSIDRGTLRIDTWAFKCARDGSYEKQPYLYDTLTLKK